MKKTKTCSCGKKADGPGIFSAWGYCMTCTKTAASQVQVLYQGQTVSLDQLPPELWQMWQFAVANKL